MLSKIISQMSCKTELEIRTRKKHARDDLESLFSGYRIKDLGSQGTLGVLFLAERNDGNKEVIKTHLNDPRCRERLMIESDLMECLGEEVFLRRISISDSEYLIMRFCEEVSGELSLEKVRQLCEEIGSHTPDIVKLNPNIPTFADYFFIQGDAWMI